MAALQTLVDYLLSAGGNYLSTAGELRLFYIDQKDSDFVLSYRDYTESTSTLGPQKTVTDGVKQDSSASYIPVQSKSPYIVCVSPSSTLRALEFDEDEDEWADSTSFKKSAIHPSGQVTSVIDEQQNIFVFFQDPAGQLIVTQGSSSIQTLPADAISSTPLSAATINKNNSVILFYIGKDNFVHYLTYKDGKWADTILAQVTFKTVPKRIVAYSADDGVINVLAISDNSALVVISSNGEKTVVGTVDPNGKFVPGTAEECGWTIQIGSQNNCVCM